ncbi:GAF domain-containing sensor histidine kinase [Aggregicoccus sp. 17bor-14]|uniref:sensor histidine kinase n=1 Tax=Myxococcaceae TaxID=31 RepID=UPI00129D17A2|nr:MULTISPECIES: GAF domain-containing sensor histidine kinase [Myxococcaceae]MBF5046561.1 GAF domain-containing sensor histidine kinase [Simulacricoccus sp. 17bor-14]MRI92272.1 GAF domain-containing sensor histidine kinase [Aggregicoccus sp. 17bor-14]
MRRMPEPFSREELSREDMGALLEAVQELAYLRELDDVMAFVRRTARALTGADGVTFVLREGDHVHYADEDAIAPLWKGHRFAMSSCVSGWAILHREPAVIEDVFADPRVPHEVYRQTFVKSLAMVPLRRAEPIGAIGAYWATSRRATPREVQLLQALADSAAVAVDNGRLYALEQRARERAEAEAALRREFVATVSHDLKNPLATITMSATMLGPLVVALNGRARHHLERIQRAAWRMDRMVTDLLDMAAIEAGALHVRPVPVDLHGLLDQVAEFAPLASERNQVLEIQLPELRAAVECDPDRIHQVFSNLVGNAVKFTPEGGSIRVSARIEDGHVAFSVVDSGPGLPEALLAQPFQPFRRGTEQTDRRGVGLGLSIAYGLVSAHGGTLRGSNAVAGGAVFEFTLPRSTARG